MKLIFFYPRTEKAVHLTPPVLNKRKANYPKIECDESLVDLSLSHAERLQSIVKIICSKEESGLKLYFKNFFSPQQSSNNGILGSLIDILHQTTADIDKNCPKNVSFVPEIKDHDDATNLNAYNQNLSKLKQSLDELIKYEREIDEFIDATANYPSQSSLNKNMVKFLDTNNNLFIQSINQSI
jgi:hypothetical protein